MVEIDDFKFVIGLYYRELLLGLFIIENEASG